MYVTLATVIAFVDNLGVAEQYVVQTFSRFSDFWQICNSGIRLFFWRLLRDFLRFFVRFDREVFFAKVNPDN